MWRIYNQFKDNILFVDIETSGFYGDITVIGVYDGENTKTMVRGINLDKDLLKKTLAQANMLVTFNGSSFDLPVIERYFQNVIPNVPHVDLRHVCSKIGLIGGLKNIEKEVGINRAKELEGVDGSDAVYLWQQYKATGNREYLNTLVQYNEEDIINLKPLAEFAINKLWKQTHGKKEKNALRKT